MPKAAQISAECKDCQKKFSTRYNLTKHCRNVHNKNPESVSFDHTMYNYKCLEEGCKRSFPRCMDLVRHLEVEHEMKIEKEERHFNNFEEFNTWKNEIETKELCNYVSARSKKSLISEKTTLHYYICNRSGIARVKTGNLQRAKKVKGSCKLGCACTSQMNLRKDKYGIFVKRIKTHYGHDKEIEHLRLNVTDRKEIASKLLNGVPKASILDTYKKMKGPDLKRIDFITRKDIENIRKSFKLENQDGTRYINAPINVEALISEYENFQGEFNPILFQKQEGQTSPGFKDSDFCLILMNDAQAALLAGLGHNIVIIDSTHGLNNYDFEMTTIMVVDEFKESFPVAFMFTNRKDAFVQKIFFDSVKKTVGAINCTTLMTDPTSVFYNAWVQTMGGVEHHVFCPWYIDRDWQLHALKIIDKEKRQWALRTVRLLHKSVDDSVFYDQLVLAVDYMLDDDDIRNFGIYFKDNYFDNCEKWAYCYRKEFGIDSKMKLESVHKVIKYFCLDSKCVKRMDKGLHATLRYVRDRLIDRAVKQAGEENLYETEIHEIHTIAVGLNFELIQKHGQVWQVSYGQTNYLVQRNFDASKCCSLVCDFCDICVHGYSCNCPDFLMSTTICAHIHFVHMYNKDNESETIIINCADTSDDSDMEIKNESTSHTVYKRSSLDDQGTNNDGIIRLENSIVLLSGDSSLMTNEEEALTLKCTNNDDLKDSVLEKLSLLHTKIQEIDASQTDTEVLEEINSHVDNIYNVFNLALKSDVDDDSGLCYFSEDCKELIVNQHFFSDHSYGLIAPNDA